MNPNPSDSTPNQAPEPRQDSDRAPADQLIIRIDRYTVLSDILTKPRLMWYTAGLITLLISFLFVGLTLAAITLKRIYPYTDFQTNAWGAMMIRTEEKEITYWLFNTAELWANSGIQVKEGDVLTIRASGRSHTAIHHLIENARCNNVLTDPWSGTEGFEHKENERDRLRAKWRIIPHKPQDALIMWVAPPKSTDWEESTDRSQLYLIGKERTELRIAQSGELRFAVNDIILTPSTIYHMVLDHLKTIVQDQQEDQKQELNDLLREFPERDSLITQEKVKKLFEYLETETTNLKKLYKKKEGPSGYEFGPYPTSGTELTNEIYRNEMSYYNEQKYINAWYDDNIGSFLIVIERKKQ